ncbi:hypothetical protein [Anaplasma capra]|uniref:hypothetical protein n=1 Tax=Anaplasma capra TaxID=1562740 RepID=UPI0021D5ACA2|nr:hypothetical protein [Anaplasma capra]MCU7611493.1 hypothetical protein [Anaplasma capra]MCU7612068.1 hypothetical protein [Anaplasma capra]
MLFQDHPEALAVGILNGSLDISHMEELEGGWHEKGSNPEKMILRKEGSLPYVQCQ